MDIKEELQAMILTGIYHAENTDYVGEADYWEGYTFAAKELLDKVVMQEKSNLDSVSCWVVIYRHNHGTDSFPIFQKNQPTEEEAQRATGCFENKKNEDVEVLGPWKIPKETQQKK